MTHLSERDYAILKAKISAQLCQGIAMTSWNDEACLLMAKRACLAASTILSECGIEEVKHPQHLQPLNPQLTKSIQEYLASHSPPFKINSMSNEGVKQ